MSTTIHESPDITTYRDRVRTYMEENLPRRNHAQPWNPLQDDDDRASVNRDLQQRLYRGGLAGLCYPVEYGDRRAHV